MRIWRISLRIYNKNHYSMDWHVLFSNLEVALDTNIWQRVWFLRELPVGLALGFLEINK